MRTSRAILVLLLLLSATFTLATVLQPQAARSTAHSPSDSPLNLFMGDSRRMFANHFYVKADVYFHSGFYPSIFDQARDSEVKENHIAAAQQGKEDKPEQEEGMNFLGEPKDWIDRMGRHFRITEHTHLGGENAREILPWLKISAVLDPQRIETYTVASYWLRGIGKTDEAEQFLRQGLRANPNSYQILHELGRLLYENRHDPARARNIWMQALRRWRETQQGLKEPDEGSLERITGDLAKLEEREGHYADAIKWFELTRLHSPNPDDVQKRIDSLRLKLAAPEHP